MRVLFHNHLRQSNIKIVIDGKNILILRPLSSKDVSSELLKNGKICEIRIFESQNPDNDRLYTTYVFDGLKSEFHIGMITTRIMYGEKDITSSVMADQGMYFLRIHNMTDQSLCLNFIGIIPPKSYVLWGGYSHEGISFGTTLEDILQDYPKFVIEKPVSDVYYGYVSEIQQKLYGGDMRSGTIMKDDNHITYIS